MDMQNRVGSKFGGGGVQSSSSSARDQKDRLRALALETIDLNKDPYFMRNHLGTYECKLCLTLHNNEGSYLAHTQAKKHQTNLGRRAKEEEKAKAMVQPSQLSANSQYGNNESSQVIRSAKIGKPDYTINKSLDPVTRQKCLSFTLNYPALPSSLTPRYRFMSSYEQKIELPSKKYQYLIFAAGDYENVAFKIPNASIDKTDGKFVTSWGAAEKVFCLTLFFLNDVELSKVGEGADVEMA